MTHRTVLQARTFIRRVKAFFFWGWALRDSVDWDFESIYDILEIKFKRIHTCLKVDPYYGNPKALKKLQVCINLIDRLKSDSYVDLACPKFKEISTRRLKQYTEDGILIKFSKEDSKIIKRAWKDADNLEKQDREMLFSLITKNINKWWS